MYFLTSLTLQLVLLKAYGKKGDEAIMKEIEQLHTRKALLPCSRNDMTYDERKKALTYLMCLKEKRDGSIKARGCADGRPQRIYTNKEDTSSPTISIEAMVLSCAMDAKENRYVVVSDSPGEFLHADMEEKCAHTTTRDSGRNDRETRSVHVQETQMV